MRKFYHYLVRRHKKFLQFLRDLYAPTNSVVTFEDKTHVSSSGSRRCNDNYKNYKKVLQENYGRKHQRHEQHR